MYLSLTNLFQVKQIETELCADLVDTKINSEPQFGTDHIDP